MAFAPFLSVLELLPVRTVGLAGAHTAYKKTDNEKLYMSLNKHNDYHFVSAEEKRHSD